MTIFTNANIVLPNEMVYGSLRSENGMIAAIEIDHADHSIDLAGDFLLPGIIDLHTDNLERQVLPRSNARWPSRSAFLSHDAQCAAAGITTVFDALCLGDIGFEKGRARTFTDGVEDLRILAASDMLKAEHFLHLRCELPAPEMPEMLARAIKNPQVRMVSLMDHSPGHGQYADIAGYQRMRAAEGYSPAEITGMIALLQENHARHHVPNRRFVLDAALGSNIPLASHDDRTAQDIARNKSENINISEFPVSLEAARAARAHGIGTIAGAPNIVRGGSHSGNVAVVELIRENLLDALASDYVPAAMLEAVFCILRENILPLPAATALISSGPAALAGLHDRGAIIPGLRADLVQVRLHGDIPVIRAVWRGGVRIA
jgi:alpha-D-ribose 1-methylphosphonate 5-triphosphate diphosphatase